MAYTMKQVEDMVREAKQKNPDKETFRIIAWDDEGMVKDIAESQFDQGEGYCKLFLKSGGFAKWFRDWVERMLDSPKITIEAFTYGKEGW